MLMTPMLWKPFWSPDFSEIKAALTYPVIFDGRNLYNPSRLKEHGLQYFAIGRQNYLEDRAAVPKGKPIDDLDTSIEILKADNIVLS